MKIADDSMKVTKALPAAGASASTDAVDLKAARVGPVGAQLEVHVVCPAVPALVDDKTITFELQDCDTSGGTYATVETTGNMVITGVNTPGAAAKTWRLYLPPDTRRYIKLKASVLAAGGDNTGVTYSLEFRV